MKKLCYTLALIPSFSLAEDILLVSNNAGNSQDLMDFLVNEGHTVTRDARGAGPAANDATDFDLVIIARASNSGDYANSNAEREAWNTLPLPLINFNAYLYRTNRWGWSTSDTLTTASTSGFDDPYLLPDDPFVSGLSTTIFVTPPPTATCPLTDLVGGTISIASMDGGTNAGLFRIPEGTTLSDPNGSTTVAPRIGYLAGNSGQWGNVTEDAKQILRNIITEVTTSVDTDEDGIDDKYELKNTDPASATALVPGDDSDLDGLTNLQEYLGQDSSNADHGFGQTQASKEDSDDDGIFDNEEITGSQNVLFGSEATDPNKIDSDDDSISDPDEISGVLNIANANAPTNPAQFDTDSDGMDDGYEVANNTNGGLDPNIDDAAGNLDGDPTPLSNLDEYNGTTLGVQTRADLADTDADGYDDVVESNTGTWTSVTATGSDPTDPDTDGDTILDGQENFDLAAFPGLAVFPTNSDPNRFHSDDDGLGDFREVTDYGTNPADSDTDADTHQDDAELFAYETDPTDSESVPTLAQLSSLRVNFARSGTSVNGFQDYLAVHEDIASFTPQIFNAFGVSVTVAPSWNADGGAVNAEAPQYLNRGTNLNAIEARDLIRNWTGTDNRRIPGDPMTLTISGLPAGTYSWKSLHHDIDNQTGTFGVEFTHAGGVDSFTGVEITDTDNDGVTEFENYGTFEHFFSSDGEDISIAFSSESESGVNPIQELFFVMNAFYIESSLPPEGPKITTVEFLPSGDLQLVFSPASPGLILTSSEDLFSDFEEVTDAQFNGLDTFTIPARFANAAKNFFRVEQP